MRIFINLLILFFVTCPFVYSETQVSGTIDQDTTWTINESPYVVTSDIKIQSSTETETAILTIEPGVEVRFMQNTGLYIGESYNGILIAKGTKDLPIIFTTNSSYLVNWKGIYFKNKADDEQSNMENCLIEYAGHDAESASIICDVPISIKNCTIQKSNGFPIKVPSNNIKISNLHYKDNKVQATWLSGDISENTTWGNNGDESTYLIRENLHVEYSSSSGIALM